MEGLWENFLWRYFVENSVHKEIGEIIMSADVMMEQIAGASPRLKARIAGALWLIIKARLC